MRHTAAVAVVDSLVAVAGTGYERVGVAHMAAPEVGDSLDIGLGVDHVVGDILRVGHDLVAEVEGRRSLVEVGSLAVAVGAPVEDTVGVAAADTLLLMCQ